MDCNHGYLNAPTDYMKYGGTPLLEIKLGAGKIIVSEMLLESESLDPVARRLLNNLLRTL